MVKPPKSYTLEIPQYDANQHYLKASFDIVYAMVEVAKTMETYNDMRYTTLTEMLLNIIIDEDFKAKLVEERKELIKQLSSDMSTPDKNREIHSINIVFFGKWFHYAKKYMTIETKLEIFRTAPDVD